MLHLQQVLGYALMKTLFSLYDVELAGSFRKKNYYCIKGRMQAKGIWKQDPEANVWNQKRWEWRVEKAPQWGIHSLYRSPNIVSVIMSRSLRWSGYVARMEEGRNILTPWLMEPGGSMPHSQGLSSNSYPEPNQPNTSYWYLFLPSTPRPS